MSPGRDRAPAATGTPHTTLAKGIEAHRTPAAHETAVRIRSLAVVSAAMDDGRWEPDVAILDALGDLCAAASRWALVVELEEAVA